MAKAKKELEMDRRSDDRRASTDRRQSEVEVDNERRQGSRRKVQRRRQIDPTTCERDYTEPEIEFMQALDAYKRANGRMFPTCSEILEVVRDLRYFRLSEEQIAILNESEYPLTPLSTGEEAESNEDDDDLDL